MLQIEPQLKKTLLKISDTIETQMKKELEWSRGRVPIKSKQAEVCFVNALEDHGFKHEYEPGSHKSGPDVPFYINGTKYDIPVKSADRKVLTRKSKKPQCVKIANCRSETFKEFEEKRAFFNKVNLSTPGILIFERYVCLKKEVGYRVIMLDSSLLGVNNFDTCTTKYFMGQNDKGVTWRIRKTMSAQLWFDIPVAYLDDEETSLTILETGYVQRSICNHKCA